MTDGDESATDKQVHSFFSIEYYQQFFNVDTSMVVERIVSSIVPRKAPPSYLKQHIGLNPDLYGPFWIVVTLVGEPILKQETRQTIQKKIFLFNSTDILDCHQW